MPRPRSAPAGFPGNDDGDEDEGDEDGHHHDEEKENGEL